MAIFLFVYGSNYHCVRIGFTGQRPLVYALYAFDNYEQLPFIQGQTYRTVSTGQYEWLRRHLECDVSFVPGCCLEQFDGNLECRTHGLFYHIFDVNDPIILDLFEDRQI